LVAVLMWEQRLLIAISLGSAVLSAVLGAWSWHIFRKLGTLEATNQPGDGPVVDVIVPARNEQRDLLAAVRSILAQQSIELRVILVNDSSTDRTRELADLLAAEDSRVRVIHDPPLVDGWLGKANAMQCGLLASTAKYIVFTDADIIFAPRCFASALGDMRQRQIDFLSLCPKFEFESFWENVLLPHSLVAGTVHFLFQAPNDPRSPNAAAAGAFMATRRDVLDRLGGLECVRTEMIDDMALARRVKQQGFKTWLWPAPNLLRVRLFKGNRDAFWGLTKNILGVVNRAWMAVPLMLLPCLVYWVPVATAVIGVARRDLVMALSGFEAYAVQAALLVLVTPVCHLRWLKALCFPLAPLPVVCCIFRALYHRYRNSAVLWRGRAVSIR
jgi:hypothetical protein